MNVRAFNRENVQTDLHLEILGSIAQGTFAKVFRAQLKSIDGKTNNLNESVAIKQIPLDLSHSERELIILRKLNHPNIIAFRYHFYNVEKTETSNIEGEKYLNIVFDYVTNNLFTLYNYYIQYKEYVPILFTKIIIYQLFRGLAYLHSKGIVHRDIKPQNLLVESPKHVLKIGDFGSAKELFTGETNISYVCSRYYRAPELALGCESYSFSIDIWSVGCIIAELLLGHPLFGAKDSVELLSMMFQTLGTPTKDDFFNMNSAFCSYNFPQLPKCDFFKLFKNKEDNQNKDVNQLIDLLLSILVYNPSNRIDAKTALTHPCFISLVEDAATFIHTGSRNVPDFTDFSNEELSFEPDLYKLKACFENKLKQLQENPIP